MRNFIFVAALAATFLSCTDKKEKTEATATGDNKTPAPVATDLPYTAMYPGNFTQDVSDADLKTVMMSYKEWENGDMNKAASYYADSIYWMRNNGEQKMWSKPDLMNLWTLYRDSLSSVQIRFDAWDKAYSPEKKENYILTWYTEIDTYKTGKVDSAEYHDINQVTNGKINWYSQYRRAKLK